ncbi:hypothetical protein C8J56DRAFT_1044904 [Mycena floridula]|nr:hypothetical protein C8J56DRAFT_1044904 [Mycena floridula]
MLQNTGSATSGINFGQLSPLSLDVGVGSTLAFAGDILARCPNLKECHIMIVGSKPAPTEWHFEPLTLLYLFSFSLLPPPQPSTAHVPPSPYLHGDLLAVSSSSQLY